VPSLAHEVLVELFRNRPPLIRELLSVCERYTETIAAIQALDAG